MWFISGMKSWLYSFFNEDLSLFRDLTLIVSSYLILSQFLDSNSQYNIPLLIFWNIGWFTLSSMIYTVKYNYKNKSNSINLLARDKLVNSLGNVLFITGIPPLLIQRSQLEETSLLSLPLYISSFILLEDIFFYMAHRLLHHPKLFRKIHYLHHKEKNLHPLLAQYEHPLEGLINTGTLILSNLIIRPPILILYALSPALINSNIAAHANNFGRHYLHHKYFNCNYGTLELLDRIFGTNREELVI